MSKLTISTRNWQSIPAKVNDNIAKEEDLLVGRWEWWLTERREDEGDGREEETRYWLLLTLKTQLETINIDYINKKV